ncbi:hypothetical protein LTR37_001486 [Vermiconidia calcicola]|uniref:Uncharacterized protein n=1 Tax=Vermiconidia calcicola TaxID=1690605 RepID=A0ACC3NW99_9PEZI|nr:hypothetical protein LTR37_001486 [Vermiconidia calcicola]
MENHLAVDPAPTLITIPGEIRNYIYEPALPHNDESTITGYQQTNVPPLCQTSRQIRQETTPIWRSSTRFSVRNNINEAIRSILDNQITRVTDARLKAGFEHIKRLHWTQMWLASRDLVHMRRPFNTFKIDIDVGGDEYRLRIESPFVDLGLKAKTAVGEAWDVEQVGVVSVMEGLLGRKLREIARVVVSCSERLPERKKVGIH